MVQKVPCFFEAREQSMLIVEDTRQALLTNVFSKIIRFHYVMDQDIDTRGPPLVRSPVVWYFTLVRIFILYKHATLTVFFCGVSDRVAQSICTQSHYPCFENMGQFVTLKVLNLKKARWKDMTLFFAPCFFRSIFWTLFFKVPNPKHISCWPHKLE